MDICLEWCGCDGEMAVCRDQKEFQNQESCTEKHNRVQGRNTLLNKTEQVKEIEIQYLIWMPKGSQRKLVENSVIENKDAIF